MKKISVILALCMVACCIFGLSGCGKKQADNAPEGMVLASGEDADYICYMPDGWNIDKSSLYTSAYYSAGDATSISVTAYGLKYTDTTVDDWWVDFLEQTESVYSDVTADDPEECTIDGIDGKKFSLSASLGGDEYKFIVSAAVKSNYVYYITYTSTPDYFDAHLESYDSVIENFEFK